MISIAPSASITPSKATEDKQLMAQIQAGSVKAFEALYDRFCARAYSVAWCICGDSGRAEDAVQEAFTAIWKHGARYLPERGSVAAWLLATVRYRAIDIARRNRPHTQQQINDQEILHEKPAWHLDSETLLSQLVAREDAAHMRDQLKRLPASQRDVIALAFYGELTHIEIAAHLNLPTGTVKGRMRLGLQKLRATSAQRL